MGPESFVGQNGCATGTRLRPVLDPNEIRSTGSTTVTLHGRSLWNGLETCIPPLPPLELAGTELWVEFTIVGLLVYLCVVVPVIAVACRVLSLSGLVVLSFVQAHTCVCQTRCLFEETTTLLLFLHSTSSNR